MSDTTERIVPRVSRVVLLARLMWRCAFCIFAVVAGNVVLMAVPQAREALQGALSPRGGHLIDGHHVPFLVAFVFWAVSAWLVTRLLLSRRFDHDTLGVPGSDPYANWVATVMPRVLTCLALLPVTLLTVQINGLLGGIVGGIALAILLFLVLRSRFGDVTLPNSYGSFDFMGPDSRQAVWGLMALSATLLAGLWHRPAGLAVGALWAFGALGLKAWDACRDWPDADPEQRQALRDEAARARIVPGASLLAAAVMLALTWQARDEIHLARLLGSPALLLFALGSWTLFGGFVLTYLPLSWRWVGLASWLPLVIFVAWSPIETHFVAPRDPPAAAANPDPPRLTASERFARWIDRLPAGDPVYLAAAVGGASRAAYWTGSVLATMEDEARRAGRPFAANLFAISSISGGSLGAAAFVAGVAQYPTTAACLEGLAARDPESTDQCLSLRLKGFLQGDFLSPVFGRLLFPDLFIRFVPVPRVLSDRADRSLGLEEAWVGDWRAQFGNEGAAVDWGAPLSQMYARAEGDGPPRLPLLLLNTVRLEDGRRFVQSVVRPGWPGVTDLFDPAFDTQRLTLAQAVHNSARFPYISPAALLQGRPDASATPDGARPALGRLGDGGYHEGSGAASLADLVEQLVADRLLRALPARKGLWACPGGWGRSARAEGCDSPSPVVALILDSSPSRFPADFVLGPAEAASTARPDVAPGSMLLPEALAPVFGGLSTRTQLSLLSQHRLSRLVGAEPSSLIELRMPLWRASMDEREKVAKLCGERRVQPSMNWYLDDCSRARLTQASGAVAEPTGKYTLAEQALLNNLGHLRQWVRASKAVAPGSER